MIKENELRIGNWVYFNDMIISVDAISEEKVRFKNSKGTFFVDPEELEPIPLTTEILDKCYALPNEVKNCKIIVVNENTGICFYPVNQIYHGTVSLVTVINNEGESVDRTEIEIPVRHLHKLQNFFFAYTGEELEIKD
jgi:hypothetical protein